MQAKRILITGGGRGLGRATAEVLLRQGHTVWITCRSQQAGDAAVKEIKSLIPSAQVDFGVLDLCSFESVRSFASQWMKNGVVLDVLFNSAGSMKQSLERKVTQDGHEEILQTNILGPFLLTQLLLPSVKKAVQPRILFMSSQLHMPNSRGKPVNWNWNDPELTHDFDPNVAYKNSKLAVNWTAFELARRLLPDHISVLAVCPGFVPETAAASTMGFTKFLMKYVLVHAPFARSKAVASVYLADYAVASKWEGRTGVFISDGQELAASKQSYDEKEAKRFWEWATKQTQPVP